MKYTVVSAENESEQSLPLWGFQTLSYSKHSTRLNFFVENFNCFGEKFTPALIFSRKWKAPDVWQYLAAIKLGFRLHSCAWILWNCQKKPIRRTNCKKQRNILLTSQASETKFKHLADLPVWQTVLFLNIKLASVDKQIVFSYILEKTSLTLRD